MSGAKLPLQVVFVLSAIVLAGGGALALTFPSALTLGKMFESDGQTETAIHYYAEWNQRHPKDYEARLHTADLLVMTVHPRQAVAHLEAMAKQWPNDVQVLRRLVDVQDSLLMVDETLPTLERLSAAAPKDPDVLRRLADHYRWQGKTDQLMATLLKLVRIENAADERQELVDTLLANRRYDDLIAWLSADPDAMPDPVEVRLALYEAYARTGRVAEATAQLRRAIELAPERLDLLRQIADHLVEHGMFHEAVSLYRSRIDRQPATASGSQGARALIAELNGLYEEEAERLAKSGQLDDAVKLYRARIAEAPRDVSLRLALAELYGPRSAEVAIRELQALLELAPDDVAAWVALAEHHDWNDDAAQAIACYRHALKLAPEDRAIRRALAQRLVWADRAPEAIAEYRRLTGAGGTDVDREAFVDLLIDTEQGPQALEVARALPPTIARGRLLGLAALSAHQYDVALPELVEWTRRSPREVGAWRALAECATALDEADLALRALRHAESLSGSPRVTRSEEE